MMRFLTVATLALALPSAAFAQVAAGSVPNTFDRPAGARSAAPQTAAPAPAVPMSPTPANAASEDTLRTLITSLQTGRPDYSLMTDDLATRLRTQVATILPVIQGFGAIQSFDFAGSRNEADIFVVNFANAETEWFIGMDEAGKVAALLFRPAESSAVAAPAAETSPQP